MSLKLIIIRVGEGTHAGFAEPRMAHLLTLSRPGRTNRNKLSQKGSFWPGKWSWPCLLSSSLEEFQRGRTLDSKQGAASQSRAQPEASRGQQRCLGARNCQGTLFSPELL